MSTKRTMLAKVARQCALALMDAGDAAKTWSAEDSRAWTRAVNALQVLSGHKIRVPPRGPS